MNALKPLWLYLEIDQWNDIWRPGIYMRRNFKLFLLTFLFIFQFISLLHEYLFCSSPTPFPITFLIVHLTLRAVPPNLLSDTKWSSGEQMNSFAAERVHDPSLSFIQWRIQRRGLGGLGHPLFLEQTETRRAEKIFFGDHPPPQSKNLDDLEPLLSQDLDPALLFTTQTLTIRRLCCHSLQSWQGRGRGA